MDSLNGHRHELGRIIYDELVRYSKTGLAPEQGLKNDFLSQEVQMWEKIDEYNSLQNSGFPGIRLGPHEIVPFDEDWLREESYRKVLYFGEKPVKVLTSSGTTSNARGITLVDALTAALLSASTSALFTDTLRDMGYDSFCKSLIYPSFKEAIEYFNINPNRGLIVPQSNVRKPFGLCIACFPAPYGTPGYEDYPTDKMLVVYGTQQIGEMIADNVVYPISRSKDIPFIPQMGEIAKLLSGRSDKPVLMELPTPTHPVLFQMMENGVIPDLKANDMIWSAGGDKTGRGLLKPTGLQNRDKGIVNYNLLGNTHDSCEWLSKPLSPIEMQTDTFMMFRDPKVFTQVFSYDTDSGMVEDGNMGLRVVLDLLYGLSRPGVMYSSDSVRLTSESFQLIGRK